MMLMYTPCTRLSSPRAWRTYGPMHLSDYMLWKNLTDAEVASRIGRDRATISRIRRRVVRPDWPTINLLKKMSLGEISADDFLELSKEKKTGPQLVKSLARSRL